MSWTRRGQTLASFYKLLLSTFGVFPSSSRRSPALFKATPPFSRSDDDNNPLRHARNRRRIDFVEAERKRFAPLRFSFSAARRGRFAFISFFSSVVVWKSLWRLSRVPLLTSRFSFNGRILMTDTLPCLFLGLCLIRTRQTFSKFPTGDL